jgi:hypothetical protein
LQAFNPCCEILNFLRELLPWLAEASAFLPAEQSESQMGESTVWLAMGVEGVFQCWLAFTFWDH